jgi:antitoxin component YwqK of YwqJK toxin-antitoxin module
VTSGLADFDHGLSYIQEMENMENYYLMENYQQEEQKEEDYYPHGAYDDNYPEDYYAYEAYDENYPEEDDDYNEYEAYAHLEPDMGGLNETQHRKKKHKKAKAKAKDTVEDLPPGPFQHWELKSIELIGKGTTITDDHNKEIRHGFWKFHEKESKKLVKSGYYDNGRVSSTWTFYDQLGNLLKTSSYIPSSSHPLQNISITNYHYNNTISSTFTLIAGLISGPYTESSPSGHPTRTTNYSKGLKHGQKTLYRASSNTVKSLKTYKDGTKHGPVKTFFENGQINEKKNYFEGQIEGEI